jgi:HAD superfamily hydrolase (TIGR01509 family)
VVFDCDGVLVDSEPLACRIGAAVLTDHGFAITYEEFLGFVGRSAADIHAMMETRFGRAVPPEIRAASRAALFAAFRRELRAIEGIADLVAGLDLPTCVASSSDHERLALALGITGLAPLFGARVFSATEVARGKPAPDLFLHAAARCGVDPTECLVVEDSAAGIAAAVAAGMCPIGFVGGGHCGPNDAARLSAAGAAAVVGRMSEIGAMLAPQ